MPLRFLDASFLLPLMSLWSSFSPSSSSVPFSSSSSSSEEFIWTSEAWSSRSVKPGSLSSSTKRSSRSSSGSSFAIMDFMRFPAVARLARLVASHSTGSSCLETSTFPSLLPLWPLSSLSEADSCSLKSSAVAMFTVKRFCHGRLWSRMHRTLCFNSSMLF